MTMTFSGPRRIAATPAMRPQVEGELSGYFVRLRNSLMKGFLARADQGLQISERTMDLAKYHFILETCGARQFLVAPPYQSKPEAIRQWIDKYLTIRRVEPVFTLSDVKLFGWPTVLGVTFNPEEVDVEKEINQLLAGVGSAHRLLNFVDPKRLERSLAMVGIQDEARQRQFIWDNPVMAFDYAEVRSPIERIRGMEVWDVRLPIARSPFNLFHFGWTDGVKLQLFRSLIYIVSCYEADVFFGPEGAAENQALTNLCARLKDPLRQKDLLVRRLMDLHLEDTRYHELGHCCIAERQLLGHEEQSQSQGTMSFNEASLLETLANFAPPFGAIRGVYAHIFGLAKSGDRQKVMQAELLLLTRLAELAEAPTIARSVELPVIAAIFPESKRINLPRFT